MELTSYAELMGDSSPVKNGYEYAENPVELSDKLLRTELEKRFIQSVTNHNLEQLEKTMDAFVDLELRTSSRYPDLLKNRLIMHMEQMLSAFSISVADYGPEEAGGGGPVPAFDGYDLRPAAQGSVRRADRGAAGL